MPLSSAQREHARAQRALREAAGQVIAKKGDDSDAIKCADLFPFWETGRQYAAGDIVRHGEGLYRVQQAVTSLAHQPPDGAGMLAVYAPVQIAGGEDEILPWINGEAGLQAGDKRMYNGTVYECIQAPGANIWPPDTVPAIWRVVG